MASSVKEKPSLTLTRKYATEPEKVWRAWTDPQTLKQWWGPGPGESVVTILFNAKGGGTELVFKHEQFFDEKARDDHKRGWTGLLEKLDDYLSKSKP